ncbi:MAG TPA: AsmA-like C-terminal region-containing protein [Vicinamibacterales bacterium]|nr:AsmA-like C-terminal region-containing protein [Vicinamibacterales bacterium]
MKKRFALWLGLAALVLGAAVVAGFWQITPFVRDRALEALNSRFESRVSLSTLQVKAFPAPALEGTGLSFRHQGREDIPPLIEVPAFSAGAGLSGLWGKTIRLRRVELAGLTIRIPAGGVNAAGRQLIKPNGQPSRGMGRRVVIDELVSRSATLEIASKDPGKLPRHFDIHNLEMWQLGAAEGASFRASLTNPKPEGRIETTGVFGPWQADEPRTTPVRGNYRFEQANLDTIKGIGGILSSNGRYQGVLERIEVSGTTETPNFSIDVARHEIPLHTTFDAIVDGTNGNTWLERVDAKLRQTAIRARGSIVRAVETKGRHITLDVSIEDGRLEDIMALAVNSAKAPMDGRMRLKSKVVIPAGDTDVVAKLQLDGTFELAQARFASLDVQRRIDTLSRRGRGDIGDEGPSVVSRLRGRFVMDQGSIRFSELTFGVPGATVQLAGSYNLRSEEIAFAGDLLLDANLRRTMSGWKSIMGFIAQPFFRRPGGGSKLPIRISGTRSNPTFGLDVKKALLPG